MFGPEIYDWFQPTVPYTWQADRAIRDNVKDQMWWSPFVDADDVKVTVTGGLVRLTGTVDSWMEYDAAVENAWEGGARRVDNDLNVRSSEESS